MDKKDKKTGKPKTRLQDFEGLCLAVKHGKEAGGTFTLRKVASGVGVERIYPIYSPMIEKIEITKRSKVRRSKLYYIRDKAAREIRRRMRRVVTGRKAKDEDDLVGLSIDAFREQVLHDNPPDKANLLKIQQLLSLTKRFLDAELLGREQKIFRKIEVNISASGLSFPSDIAYHTGQQLRLDLFFPKFPFTYVSVMGEVVRSEKADIGYEIKLHFKDVSEKTQDEIIKFVKNYQNSK